MGFVLNVLFGIVLFYVLFFFLMVAIGVILDFWYAIFPSKLPTGSRQEDRP